jgi:aminoglycoside 6'-N-acetyltransferase
VRIDDELLLRALGPGDVPTLGRWLRQPDLGYESDEDNDDASVSERYSRGPDDARSQWIIEHNGTDIGYFRWYPAYAPFWQELHGYSSEERLYGFDIFIGDLERQGRGLGRRVVTGAAAHLLRTEATTVIVDVAETNERALRCYRGAGFDEVRRFDGEDGPSVLLERRSAGSPRLNEQHEANRRHWDRSAPRWRTLRDSDGLWRRCVDEPGVAFEGGAWELIAAANVNLRDLRACVVGSGDAYAVFALAGAGARVTAVDISQGQLDVASERADLLGLDPEFVRADAADLGVLAPEQFWSSPRMDSSSGSPTLIKCSPRSTAF